MKNATAGGNEDDIEAEFRRVMSYVTERACVDGMEEAVMAALFDVLNEMPTTVRGPGRRRRSGRRLR